MNALKYAAAVVGTAIAAVAISAPAAHADTQDFLYDVQSQGWYANRGDSVLVANGFKVCRMLNSATGDVVAEYVYENTPSSVSRREAAEFVILAVAHLCPQHDHSGQTNA